MFKSKSYYNKIFKTIIEQYYVDEFAKIIQCSIQFNEQFNEVTGRYIIVNDYLSVYRYNVTYERDYDQVTVSRYELITDRTVKPKIESIPVLLSDSH